MSLKYSFYILWFLIIALLIIILYPVYASADEIYIPVNKTTVGRYTPVSRDVKEQIDDDLLKYCSIDQRGIATVIIQSESQFNPLAVGDNGTSFGLVQIHTSVHPDISIFQAEDIDFSIQFLCKNLMKGKGKMWSTYPIHSD